MIGSVVRNTPELVKPGNTAGLEFLDEAERIRRESAKLRAQGVRVQVVVIHEGADGRRERDRRPPGGAVGGPDHRRSSTKLQDTTVDLVVAGHTHRAANTVIGRIPVVEGFNAGDQLLGRAAAWSTTATCAWTGAATRLAKNLGVAQRADVKAIVDKANADTAPLRNVVIGSQTVDIPRDNPARLKESAMGNFVADAMRPKYADDGVQVAITNSGGLRADLVARASTGGEQPGQITWGEAFAVLPFGNAHGDRDAHLRAARGRAGERLQAAVRRLVRRHRPHAAVLGMWVRVPLQRHRAGDRQRLARAARAAADHGAARPGQHRPHRHQRLHVRRWRRLHGAVGRHGRAADGRPAARRADRLHQGELAGRAASSTAVGGHGRRRPAVGGHGASPWRHGPPAAGARRAARRAPRRARGAEAGHGSTALVIGRGRDRQDDARARVRGAGGPAGAAAAGRVRRPGHAAHARPAARRGGRDRRAAGPRAGGDGPTTASSRR